MKKKIISFILAVIMVIGLIPVNVFADELEELPLSQEEVEEVVEELPEEVTEKLPEEATEELPEEKTEELPEEVYEELEMPVFFAGNEVSNVTPTKATVNFTAQAEGAFLFAPQYNMEVSSDEAEKFDYTDSVSGVSALDVLVKAHELIYDKNFTAETKDDYLVVSEAGYVTTIFGIETGCNGFVVNGGYPNDRTESSYGGYNGTTVTTTLINDNDTVEFFIYQDTDYYADNYTYVTSPENAVAGTSFTVNVKGLCYMSGYLYLTSADMKKAAEAIEGISIATVDTKTGEVTKLDVKTDEKGDAALTLAEAGEYMLTAYGADKNDTPVIMSPVKVTVKPVVVTVNVAPKTASVEFYSGDNAQTKLGEDKVTDKGAVKVGSYTYHQYVLTVPAGTYSYRGKDGETDLGGEEFSVSANTTINLLRVNVRYNGTSLNQEGDYSFTLKNGDKEVVCGTQYVTSNIRYTPTLLIAGVKHTGTTTLAGKWGDEFYLTKNGDFDTTPSPTATSAATVNLPITQYKIIRVTAPKDAKTTFYKQDANYVVEPVTPDTSTDNGDTVTYQFKGTAAHSNYQFRSMKEGKVTQAGYLTDGKYVNVTFPDDHTPSSVTSTMDYDDNGVLLNVSAKNKLNLEVGETFKLRAFRAAWEIINTTTGNQMIEPDFNYQILSGDDVISITPTTECKNEKFPKATNGNATGNWMNITAKEVGTAIVAVYYDAIDVYGANPPAADAFSTFGATRDDRYGIFVVTVGENENITWNPVSQDSDWDAEFDTVYYNGEKGYFSFKPAETVTKVTVQNVLGTNLGTAQTVTAEADGSYKVPVTTGANIIAVETANGTDYQIVRAKKINYYIKNNTTGEKVTNGAPAIKTGDSVTISFDKLDMPIPKMSGIYNPGYQGTAKTAYMLNGSILLTSTGTQYDFSTNNSISFTAHFVGANSLKGYISLSSMGDPFGNHRNINDDGKPVNTNAAENFGSFGSLPDISFEVTDSGEPASYEDATAITSFTVKGANSTGYVTGFANWTKAENGSTNWKATTTAMAEYAITANVKTKDYNNTLELRYWYDGDDEVKSINLNSGVTATVPSFTLDADKILNLQVVIAPLDEKVGSAKTYTYIVYPGNANLKYVHPVIKSLTAKAGGKPLAISPAVDTATLFYTLDVKCNDKITLNAEQLIQIYNTAVTADKSDTVVLTKFKGGEAVGDPITILAGGEPTNPNRYWELKDLDIADADTLKIVVTSYVNSEINRTYTISLKKAVDHNYRDPKYSWNNDQCTATKTCKLCADGTEGHTITETKTGYYVKDTAATCTADETGHYEVTFDEPFGSAKKDPDTVTKLGTAKGHKASEAKGGQAATCTEDGWEDYYECTNDGCGKIFSDSDCKNEITDLGAWKNGEGKLLSPGHDYNAATYQWNEDHTSCTATKVCKNCKSGEGHEITEPVSGNAIKFTEVTPANCTAAKTGYYTATFSADNGFGTKTTDTISVGNPLGHEYGEPVWKWADNGKSATATFTCENDQNHVEVLNVALEKGITAEVKTPAACETKGTTTYKAEVTFNEKTYNDTKEVVDIDATGHTFAEKWSYDDTYHWHSATCGHNVVSEKTTHSFDDWTEISGTQSLKRECSVCGMAQTKMKEITNPEEVKDLVDKDTGNVSIKVEPSTPGETAAKAVIPAGTVKAIQSAAEKDDAVKGVDIELGEKTSVSYDAKAFEKIAETLGESAEISLELGSVDEGDVENLDVPAKQKEVLKEALSGEGSKAELVQIELTVNGQEMSDFGGGKATVTVPYNGEAANVIVERVEADGTKTPVPSWLNDDGSVSFETGSHSFYLINEGYQITLDANGGYVTETLVVTGADGTVPTLPDAVRNKYRFVGWFDGNKEVKAGNIISANVTLKAHWEYDGNTTTVVIGKRDNKEETKEVEENPNTGAPVPDFGMSFTVLGAICLVLFEKKKG